MINIIKYPTRQAEFEIQALLYIALKREGLNVRGEVKAYKSRLDLVIFNDDNKAICIIEVKSNQRPKQRKYKRVTKYEELFHLPVLICMHKSQINDTISQIKGIINDSSNNS